MGIEKVILKQDRMSLYFTNSHPKYFQSEIFGKLVQYACSRADRCRLVEDKNREGKPTGKRYMVVQQVKTISGALHLLNKILEGIH